MCSKVTQENISRVACEVDLAVKGGCATTGTSLYSQLAAVKTGQSKAIECAGFNINCPVVPGSIRDRISRLIENEDRHKPQSDEEIARELVGQGVDVSRRTVTKYRKAMGIASSRQRRQY